ncbi:MAG: Holliday junction resolvase RuvX [Proteobacteria bacterium]|nr:Holliday junction resolvase RuvX [Pseudomonadota bacterium]
MSDTREINTLLCFDFGTKRIGVAVGQSITQTAAPLQTVKNKNNRPDWDHIKQLIDEWKPDALIVGVPLNMMGEIQEMTIASEKFMRQLHGRFHLRVYGVDERLSSFEAAQRTGKTTDLDPIAAQAILETWFAEDHNKRGS